MSKYLKYFKNAQQIIKKRTLNKITSATLNYK